MNIPALIQLAQAGGGGGGSAWGTLLIPAAFVLVFYALLIRPQRQQEKAQNDMRQSLKRGDVIVTSGGLYGKVTGLSDDVVTVEIADRVRVKVSRTAIAGRPSEGGSGAASGEDKG